MMEGACTALPTAENHLLDLWPDLENRIPDTFAAPKSYFKFILQMLDTEQLLGY